MSTEPSAAAQEQTAQPAVEQKQELAAIPPAVDDVSTKVRITLKRCSL